MIRIRFSDASKKREALGFLPGRFSFKSWASGEMLVSEAALGALAQQDISFEVIGRPTYR